MDMRLGDVANTAATNLVYSYVSWYTYTGISIGYKPSNVFLGCRLCKDKNPSKLGDTKARIIKLDSEVI